ncbi:hypothetical protein ABIE53_000296 [Burkholderia sp. OAS925]
MSCISREEVDFAFHFADHLSRAAVLARVGLVDRLREFVGGKTHHRHRAEVACDFGERGLAGALADPDFEAVGVLMRDQNLAAAREAVGHEPRGNRRRRRAFGVVRLLCHRRRGNLGGSRRCRRR